MPLANPLRAVHTIAGFVIAATLTSVSSGALIVVSDHSLFSSIVSSAGGSELGVTFGRYTGYYDSGLNGGSGDAAWTATAVGGLRAGGGMISTNVVSASLTMNFASSNVFAIGGEFFATNFDFDTVNGAMKVEVDGLGYVFNTHALSNGFVGFVNTSGEMHTITISLFGSGSGSRFATTDGMVVGAIPAPGALAVVAIGSLVAGRRRRAEAVS